MKVTIEIDMTPEEARELVVPSDQQAELGGSYIHNGFLLYKKAQWI